MPGADRSPGPPACHHQGPRSAATRALFLGKRFHGAHATGSEPRDQGRHEAGSEKECRYDGEDQGVIGGHPVASLQVSRVLWKRTARRWRERLVRIMGVIGDETLDDLADGRPSPRS
jgi:hypothetical protein